MSFISSRQALADSVVMLLVENWVSGISLAKSKSLLTCVLGLLKAICIYI